MATVLVVEDNAANMKLAVFLLESAGQTVLTAPMPRPGSRSRAAVDPT